MKTFLHSLPFHLFTENTPSVGSIYTLHYVSDEVSFNERKEIITHGWIQFFSNITCNDKCHNLPKSLCTILPLSLLRIF